MPPIAEETPRWTSANRPKVTASSSGMPRLVLICAEMSTTCARTTARQRYPVRWRMSSSAMISRLVDRDLPQQIEVRQHLARSKHHRRQGILRHGERQAGFLAEPFVEVLEQRAAARQHDPAVHDVRRQLGG